MPTDCPIRSKGFGTINTVSSFVPHLSSSPTHSCMQERISRGKHNLGPRQRHREAQGAPQDRQVARFWRLLGKLVDVQFVHQSHRRPGLDLVTCIRSSMLFSPLCLWFCDLASLVPPLSRQDSDSQVSLWFSLRPTGKYWLLLTQGGSSHLERGQLAVLSNIDTDGRPSPHSELKFFYQEGASHLFPEAWQVCCMTFGKYMFNLILGMNTSPQSPKQNDKTWS